MFLRVMPPEESAPPSPLDPMVTRDASHSRGKLGEKMRGNRPTDEAATSQGRIRLLPSELVDQIAPHLVPLFDRPVVVWGHSYGGIVAREVICRLQDRHGCEPLHFMVTGTVSPHLIHLWQKREVLLKAMVADNSPEYLISLSRYVDDPEFLKSILPLMRRDFPLLQGYRFQPNSPLDCPITAFGGTEDPIVSREALQGWGEQTSSPFNVVLFAGDHFFLRTAEGQLLQAIDAMAASCL